MLKTRMNTLDMIMNLINTLIFDMNMLNMSESSDSKSHDPPAFGGEDTESEEPSQYVCSEDESSQTKGVVEGMIESRMVVHEGERGEPSVDSWEAEYREMQRNYRVLEIVADRVLALPHTPEVGSSNQSSPSGSVGIAVASASDGVDIRLQMMLAKLGVYIAWWLAGLREPTFEQFMYLYYISKQQRNFGWVQANCEIGYFIGHKPSTQKSWKKRWCLAYGDWKCPRGKTVTKHIRIHFLSIGSVKWGPISKEEEDEVERGTMKVAVDLDEAERQRRLKESWAKKAEKKGAKQATGKRPRDDDEGLVADVMGKKKALQEAHQSVIRARLRLPLFDLQASPKLPFGMEDVFAEGVEKVDFSMLHQQKEVNLAMHRQEVPLVNVFLEGVKSDPEALARTHASGKDKCLLLCRSSPEDAFGEMYVNMAKANKKIQRLKRRNEMAKDKITEAHEAIREKNALLFLEELHSYIMDRLVDEQLYWEEKLPRFNPSVEINFDTSGEPPSPSPATDATPEPESTTTDASYIKS
ncbi:unnamed protein product [Prunus armeniaca]